MRPNIPRKAIRVIPLLVFGLLLLFGLLGAVALMYRQPEVDIRNQPAAVVNEAIWRQFKLPADATDASLFISSAREPTLFLQFHTGSESLRTWTAQRIAVDGLYEEPVAESLDTFSGLLPPDWFRPRDAQIAQAYQSSIDKRHTWEWLFIDTSKNVVYYLKALH